MLESLLDMSKNIMKENEISVSLARVLEMDVFKEFVLSFFFYNSGIIEISCQGYSFY